MRISSTSVPAVTATRSRSAIRAIWTNYRRSPCRCRACGWRIHRITTPKIGVSRRASGSGGRWRRWLSAMRRLEPAGTMQKPEFLRFLVAGGIAAGANFGSRFVFSMFLEYGFAVFFAYLIGMLVAFLLMRGHVFDARSGPLGPQVMPNLLASTSWQCCRL